MSLAYDLINSLEANENEEDYTTLVIDHFTRSIEIPKNITNLGVESDDDVLRLNFKMPRYLGTVDLYDFDIRVNYINAQGEDDVYQVTDKDVDDSGELMTFSWLVGPTATAYKGTTKFNVCMVITDSESMILQEYNTAVTGLPVLQGLECSERVVSEYSDILAQWEKRLFGMSAYKIAQDHDFVGTEEEWLASLKGDKGDPFTYEDFTEEQLEALTGPQGETGPKGDQGDPFTYSDFTSEQLESLRGPQGIQGEKGDKGDKGEKGDTFTYDDFTSEQLESLRGPQGIQGEKGDKGGQGEKGEQGDKGDKGDPFTYADFTSEQLESLRGPQGIQGEKGDAFTYDDFTSEQLESLKGPQGIQGEKGDKGDQGDDGISVTHEWNDSTLTITSASGTSSANLKGEQGLKGDKGDPFTYDDFTSEQLESLRGPQGIQGEKGEQGTGVTILGSYASEDELLSAHPTGEAGDGYLINGVLYVWSENSSTWTSVGNIKGPQGEKGEKGDKGDTGPQGPEYTLTDDDKNEIASAVKASLELLPQISLVDTVTGQAYTLKIQNGKLTMEAI